MLKLLRNHPLLRECVEKLNVRVLPLDEDRSISALFEDMYPITKWVKIDWARIERKSIVGYDPMLIITALEKILCIGFDKNVFVLWSTGGIPVIKADLISIAHNFDDVVCVSFEKFIFNPYND